ncbi:MAG: hypothetical protein JWQ22_1036 [Devosia sp.]|nr:hypothetical protein [Devosia sp.]
MQYFFHVRSGARSILDAEGAYFPTQQAARAEAASVARELVGRSLAADEDVDWSGAIEIATDGGVVETVGFLEAAGVLLAARKR